MFLKSEAMLCNKQRKTLSRAFVFSNAVETLVHYAESPSGAQEGRGDSSENKSHAARSAQQT